MRRTLRALLVGFAVIATLVAGFWLSDDRQAALTDIAFDDSRLGGDVDAYLASVEATVEGLRPGVEKRVIWAGTTGAETALALVYIHGFSATSEEVRPLPDKVARALGANLVFTRLAGHGRDGPAMAEPRLADWMQDVAEALAVGRAVGEKVIVMGTSTGATLASLAVHDPMARDVAGLVLISPNFRVANPAAAILTWPGVRWWGPLVAGRERAFDPVNDDHARYWTTAYPTIAAIPMAASVAAARKADHADAPVPALFVFDPGDRVVDHRATRAIAAAWGAPAEVLEVAVGPSDDPYRHVIAGDILSPGMTDTLAQAITAWVSGLR